ncbi:hypothetical protein C7E12_21415, partial [Stenotrophomonas maltophilia]
MVHAGRTPYTVLSYRHGHFGPALAGPLRCLIYASWWVDVRHAPPVPPGHHYVVHAGRTPYTVLSYRHGHFGPALAGPLRCL